MAGDPGFGFGGGGRVEGVRRGSDVLTDVHDVEQDVHADVAAAGFGVDEVELVAGAVDKGAVQATLYFLRDVNALCQAAVTLEMYR